MSATVIHLDPIREVVREARNLCGMYGYGRRAAEQFERRAVRAAMKGDQPTQVIARQCVPPKSRRLGGGDLPPSAA